MSVLAVEGLVKTYNRRRVVDGVAMEVEQGEIVGLLGPNGAGKSTCFKMICGLVKPDKGQVFLQDKNVTGWPLYRRSREGGMGYLPQQSSLFSKLSVQANLIGVMQLLGFTRKQQRLRCQELLEQFKIAHVRKSLAGTLSGGERRRLEIARCLVADPKIIMLDEPFAAIDPVTVQNIQLVIKDLADKGISILITDHAAREILQITHRTYVVSEGRILCSGTADEIVRHEQVKREYLGELDIVTTKMEPAKPEPAKPEPSKLELAKRVEPYVTPTPAEEDLATTFSADQVVEPPDTIAFPKVAEEPTQPDRPRIVFSKPRRRNKETVKAPFRSSDLD